MRLRIAGESGRYAGHAIIEPRADRDEEITVFDGVVGISGAVHAEHAHRQRACRIHGADSHQCRHHRDLKRRGKLRERLAPLRH